MSLRIAFHAIWMSCLAVVIVLGAQFYAVLYHIDQVRETAMVQWLKANPDGEEGVRQYHLVCVGDRDARAALAKGEPLSHAECAAKVGSRSLGEALEKADSTPFVIPAPLNWIMG